MIDYTKTPPPPLKPGEVCGHGYVTPVQLTAHCPPSGTVTRTRCMQCGHTWLEATVEVM